MYIRISNSRNKWWLLLLQQMPEIVWADACLPLITHELSKIMDGKLLHLQQVSLPTAKSLKAQEAFQMLTTSNFIFTLLR
jgi:hypothetical protein